MAGITATIEDSLLDTCTVDAYTELAGELNEPEVTYTAGAATPCRFRATSGMVNIVPDFGLAGVDAMLRLPLGTTITNRDRVTVTHRYGIALAEPQTYSVAGDPAPGIASLEVKLQERHL